MIKIKIVVPYLSMIDGNAFRPRFWYRPVRLVPNAYAEEYWLWPIHCFPLLYYFLQSATVNLLAKFKRAQHAQTKKKAHRSRN